MMQRREFLLFASLFALQPRAYAQAVPMLSGTDENGKRVRLEDFQGKALLISFFTSGCNLCLSELKLMREFNMDNRNKSFVMLGVSLDEQQSDYNEYVQLISLTVPTRQRFPLMWRKAPGHQDTFGAISQTPTHFVLDKTHKLVRTRQGTFQPEDWDDLWILLG
jgi:thiol-disulfide isomerase/thioredoxin